LVCIAVVSTQLQFDWLGGVLSTLRKDPTAEGIDWTSIRADLEARGLLLPGVTVGVLNWRVGGKIGHGLGPEVTILCLSSDSRQFGFATPLHGFVGQDVLLLVVDPTDRTILDVAKWFNTLEILPATSIRLNGRVLQPVGVIRGLNMRLSTSDDRASESASDVNGISADSADSSPI